MLRVPTILLTKNSRTFSRLSGTVKTYSQDLLSSDLQNIQSVIKCNKVHHKQKLQGFYGSVTLIYTWCNACAMRCLFWTPSKLINHPGSSFPVIYRPSVFNIPDFPEPNWFSRTFEGLESPEKNPGLSQMCANPGCCPIQAAVKTIRCCRVWSGPCRRLRNVIGKVVDLCAILLGVVTSQQ